MENKWIIQFFSHTANGTFEAVFDTEEKCDKAHNELLTCQDEISQAQTFSPCLVEDDYGQRFSFNLMNYLVVKTTLDTLTRKRAEMALLQNSIASFYETEARPRRPKFDEFPSGKG